MNGSFAAVGSPARMTAMSAEAAALFQVGKSIALQTPLGERQTGKAETCHWGKLKAHSLC